MRVIQALLWLVILMSSAVAQDVPKLIGRVNDYAQVFTAEEHAILEKKLADHEGRTTNQVVILTVESLGNRPTIMNLAQETFDVWKLGQKGKDNGVLVVLVKDRIEKGGFMRIHPGYGLEGILPDVICKRILIENALKPAKEGRIYQAFDQVTTVVLAMLEKQPVASPAPIQQKNFSRELIMIALVIGVIMLFGFILVHQDRKKYRMMAEEESKKPRITPVYRDHVQPEYRRAGVAKRAAKSSARSSSPSAPSSSPDPSPEIFTSNWSSGSFSSGDSFGGGFSGGGGMSGGAGADI